MARIRRWQATERQVCRALGKTHLGGPGQPDCSGGGELVEVKDQERRVSGHQMESLLEKPWAKDQPLIVASTSGFTRLARDIAAEEGDVFLYKIYPNGRSRRIRSD